MAQIAAEIKPQDVCLVPEKRLELTTEGGLDAAGQRKALEKVVQTLKAAGIRVSVFIDPDERQIRASAAVGADCVELHTGRYAEACKSDLSCREELQRLQKAAELALKLELTLNAGHGLDYWNVAPVAAINGMHELNIGFAIIARAVLVGLDRAVREMKALLDVRQKTSLF
jgi:pyridoxine 5-phosphate synthase